MENRRSRDPGKQGSRGTAPTARAPGEAYSYRNLDIWNRAQDHAARVIKLTLELPNTVAAREIGRQLVRAAGSIGDNIAEGHGRYTIAAYRNHLSIAKGSASEVGSWLDLLRRIDYIDAATEVELHSESSVIIGALVNRMRALESQAQKLGIRLREEPADYIPGSNDAAGEDE